MQRERSGGGQWRIQLLKKEGARLHKIFKFTDFGLSLTLKKVKFVEKREGRAPPRPPLNPPLGGGELSRQACTWAVGGGGVVQSSEVKCDLTHGPTPPVGALWGP